MSTGARATVSAQSRHRAAALGAAAHERKDAPTRGAVIPPTGPRGQWARPSFCAAVLAVMAAAGCSTSTSTAALAPADTATVPVARGVPLDDEHQAVLDVPALDATARQQARTSALAAADAWLARDVDDEGWWYGAAATMSPAAQQRYKGHRPDASIGSQGVEATLTGRSTGWLAYVAVVTDGRPLEVLLSRQQLGGWLVERIGTEGEVPR